MAVEPHLANVGADLPREFPTCPQETSTGRSLKVRAGRPTDRLAGVLLHVAAVLKVFYIFLAFCTGHREGGQPVPHLDLENHRFPEAVRRYLGGPGPPFLADLGAYWGFGPELNNYILECLQRAAPLCYAIVLPNRHSGQISPGF